MTGEIPAGEWASWPWQQCRARREPRGDYGEYFGRCELRRGHALRGIVDHALERGFDVPRWSTDWSDVDPAYNDVLWAFRVPRAIVGGPRIVGCDPLRCPPGCTAHPPPADADDWSGYRVTVTREFSWGPQAWRVEVHHKAQREWPAGPVADSVCDPAPSRWWPRPTPAPEPLDLVDVVLDVGTGSAWTRAGADAKGDRIVRRAKRDAARRRAATARVVE